MRLLIFPNNQDVFWVVLGWAVLYGAVRALFTDGSNESTQTFDESAWPLAIIFGWPALYCLISHGASGLLNSRAGQTAATIIVVGKPPCAGALPARTYHGDPDVALAPAPWPKIAGVTSGEPGPPEGTHPDAGMTLASHLPFLPAPPRRR